MHGLPQWAIAQAQFMCQRDGRIIPYRVTEQKSKHSFPRKTFVNDS